MTNLYKYILFLIPLIPLIITPDTVFPFIVGKNLAFRVLVELSLVFWLAGKPKVKESYLFISVLVFTLVTAFAGILGVNAYGSFWSTFERMEGYVTMLHLCVFFMLLRTFSKRDWKIFLNVFALTSVIVGITAVSDFKGVIANAAFLSGYLMLAIIIKLILSVDSKFKYVYSVAVAFDLYLIWGTGIRGSLLGLAGGALCLYFMTCLKKRGLIVLLALFIVLSTVWHFSRNTDFIKENKTLSRIVNVSSSPSVKFRFLLWDIMWQGIKEKPLLGWGQDGQVVVYYKYRTSAISQLESPADRSHNKLIDLLITSGVLGLLSYLLIWVSMMMKLFKRYDTISIVIACGLFAYFIHNLFVFDTIVSYMGFYALLAFIDGRDDV